MVNSPARCHLLSPLQQEDIRNEVKLKEDGNEVEDENSDYAEEENDTELEDEDEDEDDEEESEIQRLILNSQHHLLADPPPRQKLPQSFSAHANLGMGLQRARRQKTMAHLAINAEDEEEEQMKDEEEDSDEEFFVAHASLLPLQKSKSAFAGFQSNAVHTTKPFDCPVVVKQESNLKTEEAKSLNEIDEIIDLRRGDVLKFRIEESSSKNSKQQVSCTSSLSSLCPNGRTESCWSAPVCLNEDESNGGSSEDDDSDNEKTVNGAGRHRHDLRRKESSWSAPSQICPQNLEILDDEAEYWMNPPEEEQRKNEAWDFERRQSNVRIMECEEEGDQEGVNQENVPEDEEGNDEEDEDEQFLMAEPANMKCLEFDEQLEEVMSTGEDEDDEESENLEKEDSTKHMRVFVQTNSQMVRRRRHFPSSRSDSQLLWQRHSASSTRPPPPPAPFPLNDGGQIIEEEENIRSGIWTIGGGMPHSRTYGGFCTSGIGREGDEEDDEEREIQLKLDELERKMNQPSLSKTALECLKEEAKADLIPESEDVIGNEKMSSNLMPQTNYQVKQPSTCSPCSSGTDDQIPMADDCPTPNLKLRAGYLPLPHSGRQKGHGIGLDTSISSSSYYSEEEEEEEQRKRRGRASALMQRSAAARLCRRGSPPMAQLDLMSESEISDLEQQIASGRLVKSYAGRSTNGPHQRESLLDEEHEANDKVALDDQENKAASFYREAHERSIQTNERMGQQQMCGSTSMPSIVYVHQRSPNYWGPGYVAADFWCSEYPIGEEQQDGPSEEANGRMSNMHRSLTVQSEFEGQIRPKWGRQRRMLPLRPDQIDPMASSNLTYSQSQRYCQEQFNNTSHTCPPSTVDYQHQIAASPSDQLRTCRSLSQSFSGTTKRRQLPKTPPSPVGDPLEQIDIATATKEYLLSVLHQTHQQRQQHQSHRREEHGTTLMEPEGMRREENFEDFSPTVPVLPSPSVIQRPILPLPLQQKWHNGQAIHGHNPDEQYTLSYGMDQSVLRHARRPMSIEGSFYEDMDGLNGNLTGGFFLARDQHRKGWDASDDLYTPDDEGERRRVSGYNLADGAKSSSGISSSCTTSSRSCDPAEPDYQQLLRRTKKTKTKVPSPNDPHAPTHRVQFPFMPRHADELRLERGDALHVAERFEDHWCFGLNLKTGQRGIFPEAHIVEIDLVEEICRSVLPDMNHQQRPEQDTFYLTMLASIEVAHHKGNDVLVQAINKVCSMYQRKEEILIPQTVLMEVSFRGIHVIDKRKKDIFRCPTFDFFYSLQNISFCGAHPKELRYFGFITKHPLLPRFACHVFLSNESTQAIVEAIGRAFKRSYDEYMAFAHPTEDIFLE